MGNMHARRFIARAAVVAALLLASHGTPRLASAHPHVWVTMETEIVFTPSKEITAFRHKWTFDEGYTSFAIQGLDKNGDGTYTREELAELAEVNIASLKDFEYFTFPKLGKAVAERLAPRDYYLEHAAGRLTLYLTIPLAIPVPLDKQRDFNLIIYDPSFFVDFAFAATSPVRLSGGPTTCAATIKNPVTPTTSVQALGEAYFTNADAAAELAARYAKTVTLSCPNS